MNGYRATVGLCLLCAIVVSAMAAQSATARVGGTTMFTCKKLGPGHNFTKAHCKGADLSVGKGEYEHVTVAEDTTTEFVTSNEGNGPNTETPVVTRLRSVISGIAFEIQSTKSTGFGTITNMTGEAGEHTVSGAGVFFHTGLTVTAPKEKGCKVKGGEIKTNPLKIHRSGLEMELEFEPEKVVPIEEFEIEGCSVGALNGVYKLEGSMRATVDGATLDFTDPRITEQGTLTLRGQKAGIDGTTTISGVDFAAGDTEYTPLSFTTTETE